MRSLYGGWPLVPSERFPDEHTVACGECGSTDLSITVEYGTLGGTRRLGNPGTRNVAVCQACGARGYHLNEGKV